MESVLKLQNLWPAIDGEVAQRIAGTFMVGGVVLAPTEDDIQMDMKAKALIRVYVENELQVLVDCEDTAAAAWKALRSTFTPALTTRVFGLKQAWADLEQEASEGVVAFYSMAVRVKLDLKDVGVSCYRPGLHDPGAVWTAGPVLKLGAEHGTY